MTAPTQPLRILLVDDETPARNRLRQLLDDLQSQQPTQVVGEAANGVDALEVAASRGIDVALVDIRMPRMDGLQLALHLARLPHPPATVFITAYDQYAINAFDLSAVDYLLKPVRAERLCEALQKAASRVVVRQNLQTLVPEGRRHLRCTERGKVLLIPIEDVLYFKAELKYVTARTARGEHLLEESLTQLETEYSARFLRVHRNCLVARAAVAGYTRAGSDEEGERWVLMLHGLDETVPVSRRQWAQVKAAIVH
jgi:two-component system response regulator AlgR